MISWLLLIALLTIFTALLGPATLASAALGAGKILAVIIVILGAVAFAHRGRPGTKAASLVRSLSTLRQR